MTASELEDAFWEAVEASGDGVWEPVMSEAIPAIIEWLRTHPAEILSFLKDAG